MTVHHDAVREAFLPIACITPNHSSGSRDLVFSSPEELISAWSQGVFYLKAPEGLNLDAARRFCEGLVAAESPYRQIPKYGELEGFISLDNNQQTKLALSRARWDQHYPTEVAEFGRQLDKIGITIIREVFRQSGIPENQWSNASGGYSSGGGSAFLNFVYYDTVSPDWGLRPHTDYGFVTILDTNAPGLQVKLNGKFEDVPVLPGHFVINFGEALHFTTLHSDRTVGAVEHRVVSQNSNDPVRQSTVYFANPKLDGMLWQPDAKGVIRGSSSVKDLFMLLEKNLTQ